MNNLLENLRSHVGRTVIFTLILLCGLTLFFAFSHDTQMRMVMLGFVTISYMLWGIVTHYIQKDLTLLKILEYVTIAIFAAVGVGTVLGWGMQ